LGDVVPFPLGKARFHIGQVVNHRLFDYRGVIIDVDPEFHGSESWYRQMARSEPPKDKPWYHVLVHGAIHQTYVAERNLESDPLPRPIEHPLVDEYFERFDGTAYLMRNSSN